MTALSVIVAGFLAVALVLTLARMEQVQGGAARVHDPFSDALAVWAVWMAFAGLVAAALYRTGLFTTLVVGGGPLLLGRLTPPLPAARAAFPLKLPLAILALLLAVLALLGVVSLTHGGIPDV